MTATRLAIVDDMTIFRDLLVEALAAVGRYELIWQASTVEEAEERLGQDLPDLLLLDVVLPDGNGLDLLERLGKRARMRVLLVTASERPPIVQRAMRLGVQAIVNKGASLDELRRALDVVAAGGSYFCAAATKILRDLALEPARTDTLTAREREIVQLVARGLSSKEIASRLGLSIKTVSNHRNNVMVKIGARNAAGLTRYALEQGLIDKEGG